MKECACVGDYCENIKIIRFFVSEKSLRLWDDVERYGRGSQATAGNGMRRKEDAIGVSSNRDKNTDKQKLNSVALVRTRTVPTERPPPVGEVSANFLRIEGCHVVSATGPHSR